MMIMMMMIMMIMMIMMMLMMMMMIKMTMIMMIAKGDRPALKSLQDGGGAPWRRAKDSDVLEDVSFDVHDFLLHFFSHHCEATQRNIIVTFALSNVSSSKTRRRIDKQSPELCSVFVVVGVLLTTEFAIVFVVVGFC